jgi:hypothetical protein
VIRNGTAVLIISVLHLGVAHAQPSVRAQSAIWAISARSADRYPNQPANQVSYWLGVKNTTDAPQVACILYLGYGLITPDHGTGGMIEGQPFQPSPHSCRNPLRANLVLPGESLFFFAGISVPEWAGPDAELTLDVSLVESPSGEAVTLATHAKLPIAKPK